MDKKYIILFIVFGVFYNFTSSAQTIKEMFYGLKPKTAVVQLANIRKQLLAGQREAAIQRYSSLISQYQSLRNAGKGVDGELLAEYAYTLALNKMYDGALLNIDRARALQAKHVDFYTAQILSLMDYPDMAEIFAKGAEEPEWLMAVYRKWSEEYKSTPVLNGEEYSTALQRANELAAKKQSIQAIVIMRELEDNYPDVFLTYICSSAVWETLGYEEMAVKQLEKGLSCMKPGDTSEENKKNYEAHLEWLKIRIEKKKSTFYMLKKRYEPEFMIYAGGTVAKSTFTINSRLGFYTNNRVSASINIGISRISSETYGNIGFSGYKTWGIFMAGLGVNEQFGGGNNVFSLAPSVGLSFLNKSQTSSFDIMLNCYIPFKSGGSVAYGISIGKTFYFNFNGLRK